MAKIDLAPMVELATEAWQPEATAVLSQQQLMRLVVVVALVITAEVVVQLQTVQLLHAVVLVVVMHRGARLGGVGLVREGRVAGAGAVVGGSGGLRAAGRGCADGDQGRGGGQDQAAACGHGFLRFRPL